MMFNMITGLGGSGGNGAKGCNVKVHTNDPSVLALLEIDTSAGEGGTPGTHGQPGFGGQPGQGGPGGNGNGGRAGHKGKNGKKGKNGRPAPTKQSKSGKPGSHGSITFCIYNDTGLAESGGTPFRVLFNKRELPKLFPVPVNFGIRGKSADDLFVYGQKLEFGPVLPINVGSISAPESQLTGFLVMRSKRVVSTLASASYPPIPAENKTRYGELPPNAAQTLSLRIPKLEESGFHLQADVWPWPDQWSAPTQCTANFRTLIKVDGIMQKYSEADGDNVSSKEYDITVDIPAQISSELSDTGLRAPRSVAPGKDRSFQVQFQLRNRSSHFPLNTRECGVALVIAGDGFTAKVCREDNDPSLSISQLPDGAGGFQRVKAFCAAPPVPPNSTQIISYIVKIPSEDDKKMPVEPGRVLLMRAELYFEGRVVQHTRVHRVRVCAPWPPLHPPSTSDLLVFVDQTFQHEDFNLLNSVAFSFGLKAVFLDYQNFAENNGGRLPADVWAPHRGKATILWMPVAQDLAQLVSTDDLASHLRAGGSLLCGAQSLFTMPPDLMRLSGNVFRRAVKIGPNLGMAELKRGLQMDGKKISGDGFICFVLGLLTAMSIEEKLRYLQEKGDALGAIMLGDLQASDYQTTVNFQSSGGCCSCLDSGIKSTQVVPMRRSAFTVRDALVSCLRTELALDRMAFMQERSTKFCIASEAIISFAEKKVIPAGRSKQLGMLARDISAAIYASELVREDSFPEDFRGLWITMGNRLRLVAMQCDSIAAEFQLDVFGAAERAKDVNIVGEVPGRPVGPSRSTNVSYHIPLRA
jgi:hypothetical protein